MRGALTNFLVRVAAKSPWVFLPPYNPPWVLYGFRRGSAGPNKFRTIPDITYHEYPGRRLGLDLHLPLATRSELPCVLMIHGGGWDVGGKSLYRGLGRLLATHGFAAVAIDYRLLGQAPWPACLDDCRTALAWLGEKASAYGISATRLTLLGDSAGAHLAALLALEAAETALPAKGVVTFFGPFELATPALKGWPRRCQEHLLGGPLTDPQALARARAISPARLVTPKAPPFLLIHGQIDVIVPPASSALMAEALIEAGVAARTIWVEGADHGLFSLGRIQPGLEEIDRMVVEFLTRVTGGPMTTFAIDPLAASSC